jgi:hypothetical protein
MACFWAVESSITPLATRYDAEIFAAASMDISELYLRLSVGGVNAAPPPTMTDRRDHAKLIIGRNRDSDKDARRVCLNKLCPVCDLVEEVFIPASRVITLCAIIQSCPLYTLGLLTCLYSVLTRIIEAIHCLPLGYGEPHPTLGYQV